MGPESAQHHHWETWEGSSCPGQQNTVTFEKTQKLQSPAHKLLQDPIFSSSSMALPAPALSSRDLTESSFLTQAPASLPAQPIPPLALALQPTGLFQHPPNPPGRCHAYFNPASCSLKQEETMLLCFAPAKGSALHGSHCGVTEHPGSAAASNVQPVLVAPCASPGKASPSPKPAAGSNTPTCGAVPQEISREGREL